MTLSSKIKLQMEPHENFSEFELTAKEKKNKYHGLDKQNFISQRHTKVQQTSQENIPGDIYQYAHIKYSADEILRKFKEYAKAKGYKAVKTFENELLLIDSRFVSKAKKLFSCILSRFKQKMLRFWVNTDEYKSLRVLQMATLNREVNQNSQMLGMLVQFSQRSLPNPQIRQDIDDEPQDLYSLQATSKYMYSKMLLQQGYTMGQKTKGFLQKVGKHSLGKPIQKSLVRWIQQMKGEMVQDLLKGFNCSRKQLTQILPFCRTTLQQFLYTRIFIDDKQITPCQIETQFKNTVKQIQKLNYITTPCQLQKQFFWITVAYQHQFSNINQKRQTLQELCKAVSPRNLQGKIQLLKIYQQVLGHNYAWRSTETIINSFK